MHMYLIPAKLFALVTAILILFASVFVTPSHANWRKDIGIFRVGIITTDKSIEALDKLAPFKLALVEALDMDVEFFRAKNATTLINALADERIEYAIFSSASYALAWVTCECIEPVVIPRSKDSTDGYHTVLIAGPNGPSSLSAVIGKPIGVLSSGSVIGAPLVSHALAGQNITIGDEQTPFTSLETPNKTLGAFSSGKIDMLIGWSSMTGDSRTGYSRGNLRQLADQFKVPAQDYRILWKSDQIPHRPHVMRKKLNGEAKRILRDTMLNMNEKDPIAYDAIEPVYGGGFVNGRHDRFKQLIEFIEAQAPQTKTAEEELPLQ